MVWCFFWEGGGLGPGCAAPLECEMPRSSAAALWASAARELRPVPQMLSICERSRGDTGAASGAAHCPGLMSGEEGVGVLVLPPLQRRRRLGLQRLLLLSALQLRPGEDLVIAKFVKP